jgi:hypothetical protein
VRNGNPAFSRCIKPWRQALLREAAGVKGQDTALHLGMDFKSASKTLVLALASGSFALTAMAQWQWIDKDGRKVFSDRAPSVDIPQKNILKEPGNKLPAALPATGTAAPAPAQAPASAPAAAASTPAATASAPKLSGKDAELEAKKKQAEEEEATKKKAEEEKQAKAKADNCERAKKALTSFQSGVRISTTNAKGEREIMDDASRTVETKRLQGIIEGDCKK